MQKDSELCPYIQNELECGGLLHYPYVCRACNKLMCPICMQKHNKSCKADRIILLDNSDTHEDYTTEEQKINIQNIGDIQAYHEKLDRDYLENNEKLKELEVERIKEHEVLDQKLQMQKLKNVESKRVLEDRINSQKEKLRKDQRRIINKRLLTLEAKNVYTEVSEKTVAALNKDKKYLEAFNELTNCKYLKEYLKVPKKPEEVKFETLEPKAPLIFNITCKRFILSDILNNEYFNENLNTLYPFSDNSSTLDNFSSIKFKNNIFICGGKRNCRTQKGSSPLSKKTYQIKLNTSAINKRDFRISMEEMNDMLEGKIYNGITASSTSVYILGGITIPRMERIASKSCECYHSDSGQWMSIAALKSPKTKMGACVFGDYIYAFSGQGGVDANVTQNEIEILDITRPLASWEIVRRGIKHLVPQMKAVPITTHSILLFGGVGNTPLKTCKYNLLSKETTLVKANSPESFKDKTCRNMDGKIYVPAFDSPTATTLYYYDSKTEEWGIVN